MKKKNVLEQRLKAEKELLQLRKKQGEIENRARQIAENCNHEIVITTWRRKAPKKMIISEIKPRMFCLLCAEYLGPRRFYPNELEGKINNAFKIYLSNYPNLCKDWESIKPVCRIKAASRSRMYNYMAFLEELYQDVRNDYPHLTEQEIGGIVERRLEAIDVFAFN